MPETKGIPRKLIECHEYDLEFALYLKVGQLYPDFTVLKGKFTFENWCYFNQALKEHDKWHEDLTVQVIERRGQEEWRVVEFPREMYLHKLKEQNAVRPCN